MKSAWACACVCIGALVVPSLGASILDFGGIPGDGSDAASVVNAKAWLQTIRAANASSAGDRVALIPANYNFTVFPIVVSGVFNVTLQVDGRLMVNNNISALEWTRGGVDYGVLGTAS